MPIKAFEFTSSADLMAEKKSQIDQMRQQAIQSKDPAQMQLANSQQFIDTLFGDPALQKAQEMEETISDAMSLEQEEGEDRFDFQIRQQKAIMERAATLDPEVAVQANQNIMGLLTEKKAQGRLDMKDKQSQQKHDWSIRKEEMERTPTIEKLNPKTGQFEAVEVGKYGTDSFEDFKARADVLNKSGGQYRVSKESSLYDLETLESEEGLSLGKTLVRKTIEGFESVTGTMDSFEPLVNLLEQDNFALQGIKFNKDGTLESSKSNDFFAELENLGQQIKSGLDMFDQENMFDREINDYVSIQDYIGNALEDPEVAKNLQDRGLSVGIAQGIITDIGYALAKMRDDGRLSDQDVSLAIRSLTGLGGVAEIGELLNVQVRKAKKKVEILRNRISESPGSVPSSTIKAAEDAVLHGQRMVSRMRKMAQDQDRTIGQTERGGVTPEQGAAYKAKYQ